MQALLRKAKSFTGLSWQTRRLFAEALATSAYVKLLLVFFPFRKVAPFLGYHSASLTDTSFTGNKQLVRAVQAAVRLCDKYAPWPTECYTRALTAKIMLRRRNVNSTLFLAFRKNSRGAIEGHSWLQCSGITVTGFCDFRSYEVHSAFS